MLFQVIAGQLQYNMFFSSETVGEYSFSSCISLTAGQDWSDTFSSLPTGQYLGNTSSLPTAGQFRSGTSSSSSLPTAGQFL